MDFENLLKSLPNWIILLAFFLAPGVGFFVVVYPDALTNLDFARLLLFSACIPAPGIVFTTGALYIKARFELTTIDSDEDREIALVAVNLFGLCLGAAEVILFCKGWRTLNCFTWAYAVSIGASVFAAFLAPWLIQKFLSCLFKTHKQKQDRE